MDDPDLVKLKHVFRKYFERPVEAHDSYLVFETNMLMRSQSKSPLVV